MVDEEAVAYLARSLLKVGLNETEIISLCRKIRTSSWLLTESDIEETVRRQLLNLQQT